MFTFIICHRSKSGKNGGFFLVLFVIKGQRDVPKSKNVWFSGLNILLLTYFKLIYYFLAKVRSCGHEFSFSEDPRAELCAPCYNFGLNFQVHKI